MVGVEELSAIMLHKGEIVDTLCHPVGQGLGLDSRVGNDDDVDGVEGDEVVKLGVMKQGPLGRPVKDTKRRSILRGSSRVEVTKVRQLAAYEGLRDGVALATRA
jgi:hypothetical protein